MAIGTKKIEDYVPVVKYNEGIYTALDLTTTGNMIVSGNLTVSGTTNIGSISLADLTTTGNTTLGNAVTDTTSINGATTITSTSASALTVGANGATNPVLKINAATASVATGVSVTGAAAAGGVALAVISSGTNESLVINAKGSGTVGLNTTVGSTGTIQIGNGTDLNGMSVQGPSTISSASTGALAVGPNGTTNPSFKVNAATASAATGIQITSAAATAGVAVDVLSSGADENLTINAKGTGTIGIGSVSTGAVTITPATTVSGKLNLGAGLGSTTQALSGAGAVNLTTLVTKITSTGADALTLADGTDGQVKIILMVVDGGDATLTPTTKTGFTTITFNDAGDGVTLVFTTTTGWICVGNNGATLA